MTVTLGDLAVRFGLALRGDPDRPVDHVGTLAGAGPRGIAFLANAKRIDELASANAAAVILPPKLADQSPLDCLLADNPHAAFARIADVLHPKAMSPAGIHPSAVVAPDAHIDPTAHIGALVVIGARSVIGARAYIGPGCVIGDDVELATDVRLVARVTVLERVTIGPRSVLDAGVVVGSEGFGNALDEGRWVHVPQVGTVRIGADVEIGANSSVDRGALEDTVIGNGVRIDNLVQIGHNCTIGEHSALAGCAGLAGSSHVGARCRIGGGAGLAGHLRICDDVTVTAYTLVTGDIREPGVYSGGIPAESAADWRRIVGRLKRIEGLARRVGDLEKQLDSTTSEE
jgi:UDP-3-O-[3-hydroxymyristoyl] glucosamine N-acyltransferase